MALISVTRAWLRSLRYLPAFLEYVDRSHSQAKLAPGNVHTTTQRKRAIFWTLTAWDDEPSIRAYTMVGAHGEVMPKLIEWCDEASVVH